VKERRKTYLDNGETKVKKREGKKGDKGQRGEWAGNEKKKERKKKG